MSRSAARLVLVSTLCVTATFYLSAGGLLLLSGSGFGLAPVAWGVGALCSAVATALGYRLAAGSALLGATFTLCLVVGVVVPLAVLGSMSNNTTSETVTVVWTGILVTLLLTTASAVAAAVVVARQPAPTVPAVAPGWGAGLVHPADVRGRDIGISAALGLIVGLWCLQSLLADAVNWVLGR